MKYTLFLLLLVSQIAVAQQVPKLNFTTDGNAYTQFVNGEIRKVDIATGEKTTLYTKEQLSVNGMPLEVQSFEVSKDGKKVLLFANTAKVWRYNTKGDYYLLQNNKLRKIGKDRPAQTLQFAKFNADASKIAYVSESNIYIEDATTAAVKALTTNGTRKFINGTFDWVYEEEFGLRDGFRWSPDGQQIAFWQIDATKIKDYYMLNTTESNYSKVIPVEYPKVGEDPSPAKVAIVNAITGVTKWMQIPGDPIKHYIVKLDWASAKDVLVQQLDRKQQTSKLINCNPATGAATVLYTETDKAWVDIQSSEPMGNSEGFRFINNSVDILWISEKDGWRHLYKISKDGKTETLLTKGNYDIDDVKAIDEKRNLVYFRASPNNPTQRYLYSVQLNGGTGEATLLSQKELEGSHNYIIAPNSNYALHVFSSHKNYPANEWIRLPEHKPIFSDKAIAKTVKEDKNNDIQYLKIKIKDNVELDAWINKPKNFDATKKYPVVLYVYGEPASTVTDDKYGEHNNYLYNGDMREDGYVQIAIDNRGTPTLKGAAWRKAIYRNIGRVNIKDMAQGMEKLLQDNAYMDKDRVAVWGWSGGGSSTLNLLFNYPNIFKTGIAIAAVGNQLFYDNIYQERYMGLPQENREDFVQGSPITHANKLEGNLLYVHGTGDDNVHYSNAEVLINELVKHKKIFQLMSYPNRTHSLSEGENTFEHLTLTYTNFLQQYCKPGAR